MVEKNYFPINTRPGPLENNDIPTYYSNDNTGSGPLENDDIPTYFSNEIANSKLFSGKIFSTWEDCDSFLNEWSKQQGFHIKKDRVQRENGFIRRHMYLCDHSQSYNSKFMKDTVTKKI